MSGCLAGAEMMTFFAPASRCLFAPSRSVKIPVDSMTMSTPSFFQGSWVGSLIWRFLMDLLSTIIVSGSGQVISEFSWP